VVRFFPAEAAPPSDSATEGWWGSKREKKTPGKQIFPRETLQKDVGGAFSQRGVHQRSCKVGGISLHGSDERVGMATRGHFPNVATV
jgi:hypothetical protein